MRAAINDNGHRGSRWPSGREGRAVSGELLPVVRLRAVVCLFAAPTEPTLVCVLGGRHLDHLV